MVSYVVRMSLSAMYLYRWVLTHDKTTYYILYTRKYIDWHGTYNYDYIYFYIRRTLHFSILLLNTSIWFLFTK